MKNRGLIFLLFIIFILPLSLKAQIIVKLGLPYNNIATLPSVKNGIATYDGDQLTVIENQGGTHVYYFNEDKICFKELE